MYDCQEELDQLVWDRNDLDYDISVKDLRMSAFIRDIEEVVYDKFGRDAECVGPVFFGGFNVLYRMRLHGHPQEVMVRLPIPFLVQDPGEKTIQEAATAVYVAKHTKVPVPHHYHYDEDSLIGPYIIMARIENNGTLSARTTFKFEDPEETHKLDPDIDQSLLSSLWTKVADCYLELAQLSFPRIGSLERTDTGTLEVLGRPITHSMVDMVRLANVPRAVLPRYGTTYATADEWLTVLAEMHLATLLFQHNDFVVSEDDCRNKYVARQIFRRLAKQGRLSTFGFAEDNWSAQSSENPGLATCPAPSRTDSFRLWGDDLRAGNILLDKNDNIAALIDWEYTYAGPSQFILDPPWWLLLTTAEQWPEGLQDWVETYEKRLQIWLSAMKQAEQTSDLSSPFPAPLSKYMQESWSTGRFWLSYAAKKCWSFDMAYWTFLDERFFGQRASNTRKEEFWKTRIDLLTKDERDAMEPFVERKMRESAERKIVKWDRSEAKERLSEILFD